MAKAIQRRRGTSAEHATFTGLAGEMTVDTDKKVVVVHDGSTPGGFPGVNFTFVAPAAAVEAEGEITLDVKNNAQSHFKHTMSGSAVLKLPLNMEDGSEITLKIDPDGNTLSYEAGYVGVDDELPDISDVTRLVIIRDGSEYEVYVAGSHFGDGS